jgi:hypothetical protein
MLGALEEWGAAAIGGLVGYGIGQSVVGEARHGNNTEREMEAG